MPFAALDLHKNFVEAVLTDDAGAITFRGRFPTNRDALLQFARRHLTPQHRLALEATLNTWAVADLLRPFVAELVISNPLRTRAIAEAKVKTDKVDAETLVHMLRLDYLPRVWHPDAATQQLRRLTTERATLVADRTRIKNRIHSVLHQRLLAAPKGDLFSKANLAWLASIEIDQPGRDSLDRHLRHLQFIEAEIESVHAKLAVIANSDEQVKLLMTLPGVDFTVALTLLSTLGDVHRFDSGDKAAAYLGLVPSTRQSAGHCYHGRITKQGRAHARWLLAQAAQHLGSHPGPLGVFFRRIARKKNRNVAVVAAAHKLVVIAWHMLRNHEPYRYAQPRTVEAKFSRLRKAAGGKRRTGGLPKGSPRPAHYGQGPTRAVPAIDAVYRREGLPAIGPCAPGEAAMLRKTGTAEFAAEIRNPKRIPRRSTS
jgi:transposase